MNLSPTSVNPFFFRRLPNDSDVFISNLLGEWNILSARELNGLAIADVEEHRLDTLAAQGFLNCAPEDAQIFRKAAEHNLTKKFMKATDRPFLIMVVPTLRCDHSCAYCQVSRAPLSSKKHDQVTNAKQAAEAIDRIAAARFKLEFQGGEPLLRTDYISDLVSHLRKLRGDAFEIVIATALGPELSSDFLLWAKREKVSLSVSFDGFPNIHSELRKSHLFDSFERAKTQLARVRKADLPVGFVATITSKTMEFAAETFIENCQKIGANRIFSRPVQPYGFAGQKIETLGCEENDLFNFLRSYLEAIIKITNEGGDFFDYCFALYLQHLAAPSAGRHVDLQSPAGYGLSAVILNYDGMFYGSDEARMLAERVDGSKLELFNPASELGLENRQTHTALLKDSFSECSAYCETCAYMPFCGSDPVHHIYTQGDITGFKPRSFFCRYATFMFDLLIQKISDKEITPTMISKWLAY